MNTKNRRRQIYEGKAKILFEGINKNTLIQYFKDDATAFNNKKKGTITGKGVINNAISAHIFNLLNLSGIETHFIKRLNMREQLVKKLEIFPLEVVVRNFASGSITKRLGIKEGKHFSRSIIEYYYKSDEYGDPLISEEHITALGWATNSELEEIQSITLRINDILIGLFYGIGIRLVDFKLEFGRDWQDEQSLIALADEISPDSCRLWDLEDNSKLDKDRFRLNLGNTAEAYQEVAKRLGVFPENFTKETK